VELKALLETQLNGMRQMAVHVVLTHFETPQWGFWLRRRDPWEGIVDSYGLGEHAWEELDRGERMRRGLFRQRAAMLVPDH